MAITTRGVRSWLYKELQTQQPFMSLGSLAPSLDSDVADGQFEKIDWLGCIPGFVEWKDKRQEAQPNDYLFSIISKKWESSFQVPCKWVRNDKTGMVQRTVKQFASRVPDLWNELVSNALNASETATCFDGQPYFSASHAWGMSGIIANKIAISAATPTAPTPVEGAKAIMALYQQMLTFKDDRGRPLPAPTAISVVCPVGTFGSHYQAITQNFLSTGTTQIDNPIPGLREAVGVSFDVVTSPFLTLANTKLMLINRSPNAAPFIRFENQGEHSYTEKGNGSDFEFDKDAWAFGLAMTGNAGYGHFADSCLGTYA